MEKIFSILCFAGLIVLLLISIVNVAFWLYFTGFKLFMNVVWQHEQFGQWLKLKTLPEPERIFLEKGKRFDDLDVAFLSAVEKIPQRKVRQNFMIRRNSIIEAIRKETNVR